MSDAQIRQALQRAFEETDKDRRGQIDPQDVEQALRRCRDSGECCCQQWDDARIKQEAARFQGQGRPVRQQEFVDYYADRLRQDDQRRQALQRAFQETDRDRRGQIDPKDVEQALRRLRDNPECRQQWDDARIKQEAAHFQNRGRPVNQQEFVDYYADRQRQDDDQLRQAVQRAFDETDRDRRGEIDPNDVEQALRRLRDNPECRQKWDDARIKQEAARFQGQGRPVRQQEFVDYYADRQRQDDQRRQALQRAFQETDRDHRGQIDPQDVEQALRRLRDSGECRQQWDDARIKQEAAHFQNRGRPVNQQEFVDYYADRQRQDDDQIRQALQRAFEDTDRDGRGKIDSQDVEQALRRCRDSPQCCQKWDDARIRQEAAHFQRQGRRVREQEFVDYYADRQRQDEQLRQALQRAFEETDRDRRGQIDPQDVEQALRRFRDSRECRQKWDDARIKQEAARFQGQGRPVRQQDFVDYYADRQRQDDQRRQALQRAYEETDRDRRGEIDPQDVEQALRRLRDNAECRQQWDDARIKQEAAHFQNRGRPVNQQEFVDHYADRQRQDDDQLRQALQRAFDETDRDRRGQIDSQDVEQALRRCRDSPECCQKWDDARIRQEAAHFQSQSRPVRQQEFVDYYADRQRQDEQLRQALQRAFEETDRDHRGQIDTQDVEQALRRLRDSPACRQKWDDRRIRQEAAHFQSQDRPVRQQEFVDYYADRQRQDEQLRQALQRAFEETDRDRRGQIDPQDVEQTLRRFRDSRECRQKWDDGRIKQEAARFQGQGRPVRQQDFVDYYADRQRQDDQRRQALQRAFDETDRDRRGQIDPQDVEQALRRLRDNPECRQQWDDARIKQEAAHFQNRGRPVNQQEFVDYYADRQRQDDDQIRQALQRAFDETDRDRKGQIDPQDVEQALRRCRDSPECCQKWDDVLIKQEAAHFQRRGRHVRQQEFVDYYADRQRQDEQLRQALQRAFEETDRDRRGQIDPQDVEQALRRFRDSRECRQKWDDGRIKQEAARFQGQGRPVRQQDFVDYYADRQRQDDQRRQALQRAFEKTDRDRRGQIDPKDVEQALRRLRKNPECRQQWDDARIKQEAAHFQNRGRPVNQQEFVDYYADRQRQDDDQIRQALQRAFDETDRDRKGQIDPKDVEQALRRCRDSPECCQKWDDARIRQEAAHFQRQGRPVRQQEFVDYYADRQRQDDQRRQALQRAFEETDRDRRGQIDPQDVEQALRRCRDSPQCCQKWDDARIKQEAAHFQRQGRPVRQQEFVDYYADRQRQDDQLRQALQRAFEETDRDRRGQIDPQDVEQALRRCRDSGECCQQWDDARIKQEAAHFQNQGRPVRQQDFVDYYADRLRQ